MVWYHTGSDYALPLPPHSRPQAPLLNPELDFLLWLHPQAVAKGFGDGELSFAADGHDTDFHWYDYSKMEVFGTLP
jgi:hypothetical protein